MLIEIIIQTGLKKDKLKYENETRRIIIKDKMACQVVLIKIEKKRYKK